MKNLIWEGRWKEEGSFLSRLALRVLFSWYRFPLLSLRPRLCLVDVGSGEAGKVSRGLLVRQALVFLIATPNSEDPLMSSLTLMWVKKQGPGGKFLIPGSIRQKDTPLILKGFNFQWFWALWVSERQFLKRRLILDGTLQAVMAEVKCCFLRRFCSVLHHTTDIEHVKYFPKMSKREGKCNSDHFHLQLFNKVLPSFSL